MLLQNANTASQHFFVFFKILYSGSDYLDPLYSSKRIVSPRSKSDTKSKSPTPKDKSPKHDKEGKLICHLIIHLFIYYYSAFLLVKDESYYFWHFWEIFWFFIFARRQVGNPGLQLVEKRTWVLEFL